GKEEVRAIGKEEGIIEGEIRGKRENINQLIKQKYYVDSMEWLNECDLEQLDRVLSVIFKDLSYNQLKEIIMN
ncbi:MAG: hypothetical protein RR585_05465, partial [Coprobacillus sp.]